MTFIHLCIGALGWGIESIVIVDEMAVTSDGGKYLTYILMTLSDMGAVCWLLRDEVCARPTF